MRVRGRRVVAVITSSGVFSCAVEPAGDELAQVQLLQPLCLRFRRTPEHLTDDLDSSKHANVHSQSTFQH